MYDRLNERYSISEYALIGEDGQILSDFMSIPAELSTVLIGITENQSTAGKAIYIQWCAFFDRTKTPDPVWVTRVARAFAAGDSFEMPIPGR